MVVLSYFKLLVLFFKFILIKIFDKPIVYFVFGSLTYLNNFNILCLMQKEHILFEMSNNTEGMFLILRCIRAWYESCGTQSTTSLRDNAHNNHKGNNKENGGVDPCSPQPHKFFFLDPLLLCWHENNIKSP